MKNMLLLLPVGLGLAMVACDEPGFVSAGVTTTRTGYYDDGGADFYYVDRTPYSRSYGPLVHRDNRYYYRRSGALVIYDRPTRRWHDSDRNVRKYRHDRREDPRDRREDLRDRREDLRDRRQDRRDDLQDRLDDRQDDVEDRRDDWRDRRI